MWFLVVKKLIGYAVEARSVKGANQHARKKGRAGRSGRKWCNLPLPPTLPSKMVIAKGSNQVRDPKQCRRESAEGRKNGEAVSQ
jgi:hypothetical protein